MVQKTKTPPEFKKYEREAKKRIIAWNAKQDVGFFQMLWQFAGDVYNRGDGLVLMDFNERTQRTFLKKKYVDWMKELSNEIDQLVDIMVEDVFGKNPNSENSKIQ